MNQFFQMIISTIKYRYSAITAKFRHWTNKEFVRAKFIVWFKIRLQSILSVKPRNKKDYYTILGFLVSRRLVHAVVIFAGLLCFCYLWYVNPIRFSQDETTKNKVYAYNSFPLKFLNADVDITAKQGYIAYSGHVKKGYAEGFGELYNEEGILVYSGNFSKNKYNGNGQQFYDTGQLKYNGEFLDNNYEGNGQLYRENGTIYYVGEFSKHYQDGQGELYNNTGKKIFTGDFKRGEIVYTQLLGKTAQELNDCYFGSQKIYQYDEKTMVALEEIGALYVSQNNENSLETGASAERIYVIRDKFALGNTTISTISELKQTFGEPLFQGNSYVDYYDAVALYWGNRQGKINEIDVEMTCENVYDELIQVEDYDADALIYMYVYEVDGLSYTFITQGYDDTFVMYIISE